MATTSFTLAATALWYLRNVPSGPWTRPLVSITMAAAPASRARAASRAVPTTAGRRCPPRPPNVGTYCVFFALPQGQPPGAGASPFALVPEAAAAAACLHAAAPQQPPPGMHPIWSAGFASAAGAAASAAAAGGRPSSSVNATALVPSTIAVRTAATSVRFIAPPGAPRTDAPPTFLTDPTRVSTAGGGSPQGCSSVRLQPRRVRTKSSRSCSRCSRWRQNSIVSGTRRNPVQYGGRGTSSVGWRRASLRHVATSDERPASGALCLDDSAARRLS